MIRVNRLALALALCGLLAVPSAIGQDREGGKSPGAKPSGGPPAAPVEVARVTVVTEAPTAEYTGLIQPATKALVSSDVAGQLARLAKRPGDPVAKNELVAELKNPALKNDLAVSQARLLETEAKVRLAATKQTRTQQLYNKKLISEQQFEEGELSMAVMEAGLQAERAQVERLRDQVRSLVIHAPIAGQVIASNLELGQWITPNQPIFEVYSYEEYELLVGLPGRLLATVPSTGGVEVSVPDLGVKLKGRIEAAVRHVDSATGNFLVRVRVSNRDGLPLSGMLAKVRVPMGVPRSLLTVPRDALVRRGERTHLVAVDDASKARILPVRVDGSYGNDVIVSGSGVEAGLTVVVRGNERLGPGAAVRIGAAQPPPPVPSR